MRYGMCAPSYIVCMCVDMRENGLENVAAAASARASRLQCVAVEIEIGYIACFSSSFTDHIAAHPLCGFCHRSSRR